MSFGRVIQDSDDDEDLEPLGELPPERTNRVPETNEVQQGAKSIEAQEVTQTSPIGVNFDAFLQSPQAPHRMPSASQQQREERWIPGTGRPGSSGNMTEIGIAQERLLDDDQQQQAQYAHQQPEFHGTEPEQHPDYDMATTEATLKSHDLPPAPAEDSIPHPEVHITNPSDDWSQTASYNIFDSSLYTPSNVLNPAELIPDSGVTAQTEPLQNFESRRWNYLQMQGEISSPHDTEPFSSVVSPKVARVEGGNFTQNIPHPSSASIDELALPATAEKPKVEKRGRPKKQSVPVIDEEDELSDPQSHEIPAAKPEKRKPGGPKEFANVLADDTVNDGPVDNSESSCHPTNEYQETRVDNAPEALFTDITVNGMPFENNAEERTEADQGQPPTAPAQEESPEIPPEPAKEPKKKKLKRSKTHESDAEDDVILLDEKPISNSTETAPYPAAEQPPAPKKRGRKKKKRAEELQQEIAAPSPELESDAQPTVPNKGSINTLNDWGTGISVVLENKHTTTTTRTQTPDTITNPTAEKLQDPAQELEVPNQHNQTSPSKPTESSPTKQQPETPQKRTDPKTPSSKGPGKHSPISSTSKVPYRVGLSKKARIAPLLKIIKR